MQQPIIIDPDALDAVRGGNDECMDAANRRYSEVLVRHIKHQHVDQYQLMFDRAKLEAKREADGVLASCRGRKTAGRG